MVTILKREQWAAWLDTRAWDEWRISLFLLCLGSIVFVSVSVYIFCLWYHDAHPPLPAFNDRPRASIASAAIHRIPAQHLFGSTNERSLQLPTTHLQLRLVGIAKAPESRFSKTIISMDGKSGKVYGVGDTLAVGVQVYAIHSHEVILQRGGSLEKLSFLKTKSGAFAV